MIFFFDHDLLLQEIASIIGVSVSELVADEKDASNTIICPHCGEKITLEAKKYLIILKSSFYVLLLRHNY